MNKLYIVTTSDGFFAQGEMPWSSMDISRIAVFFRSAGFDVEVVSFDYVRRTLPDITDSVFLYTSSQRPEHKRYIEDLVSLLPRCNLLIPSLESFNAHDNKGFQTLLDKKYNLGLIPANYYADISEVGDDVVFPCVFKPSNGASSAGVSIVHDSRSLQKAIQRLSSYSLQDLKRDLKRFFFPRRYNISWERYLSFGSQRFILQQLLPGLQHDYKILIFGNKFYGLKRNVPESDFRASGSGLHSRDLDLDDKEFVLVLDKAAEFKDHFSSHIYSLDICVYDGKAYIIEFQLTHVGPVTLSHSNCYFFLNTDQEWEKKVACSDLENEFCGAVLEYIYENTTFGA